MKSKNIYPCWILDSSCTSHCWQDDKSPFSLGHLAGGFLHHECHGPDPIDVLYPSQWQAECLEISQCDLWLRHPWGHGWLGHLAAGGGRLRLLGHLLLRRLHGAHLECTGTTQARARLPIPGLPLQAGQVHMVNCWSIVGLTNPTNNPIQLVT